MSNSMARPSIAQTIAVELVRKFPGCPKRTLARRLQTELKAKGTRATTKTIEECRGIIRYVTGAQGESRIKWAKEIRAKGVAGTVPPLPPSLSDPWLPFVIKEQGKWGIISDIHAPYHDVVALEAALRYIKKQRPDGILLNGDIADFYSISRHQKNPTKRDLKAELDSVRAILLHIRKRFPHCRIVFKQGNHEERWQHWLWNHAPEICDFPNMNLQNWFNLKELDIEYVDGKRPIMLGTLPVLHGHELPSGIASPVNPARGAFVKTLSSVLVAHSHRTSSHAEGDMWHSSWAAWSIGCLCELNPEYAVINKWNHGAALVKIENGEYSVDNLRITREGKVFQA